jgi:hypothetical protein
LRGTRTLHDPKNNDYLTAAGRYHALVADVKEMYGQPMSGELQFAAELRHRLPGMLDQLAYFDRQRQTSGSSD